MSSLRTPPANLFAFELVRYTPKNLQSMTSLEQEFVERTLLLLFCISTQHRLKAEENEVHDKRVKFIVLGDSLLLKVHTNTSALLSPAVHHFKIRRQRLSFYAETCSFTASSGKGESWPVISPWSGNSFTYTLLVE